VIANVFSIVLYKLKDNNSGEWNDEDMSALSRIYFIIDWINAFAIQWLLLFVPYHW
jgi:hypothetical protein